MKWAWRSGHDLAAAQVAALVADQNRTVLLHALQDAHASLRTSSLHNAPTHKVQQAVAKAGTAQPGQFVALSEEIGAIVSAFAREMQLQQARLNGAYLGGVGLGWSFMWCAARKPAPHPDQVVRASLGEARRWLNTVVREGIPLGIDVDGRIDDILADHDAAVAAGAAPDELVLVANKMNDLFIEVRDVLPPP